MELLLIFKNIDHGKEIEYCDKKLILYKVVNVRFVNHCVHRVC